MKVRKYESNTFVRSKVAVYNVLSYFRTKVLSYVVLSYFRTFKVIIIIVVFCLSSFVNFLLQLRTVHVHVYNVHVHVQLLAIKYKIIPAVSVQRCSTKVLNKANSTT